MRNKIKKHAKLIYGILIGILIAGISRIWVTPVIVSGNSMNPTLTDGTFAFSKNMNEQTEIKRGDIVIVNNGSYYIIKRVIGLPNETIKCEDGVIYINGEAIEDYTNVETYDFDEVVLGNDQYFVMGDNRTNSKDSRINGPIQKEQITSVGIFAIAPINEFGIID